MVWDINDTRESKSVIEIWRKLVWKWGRNTFWRENGWELNKTGEKNQGTESRARQTLIVIKINWNSVLYLKSAEIKIKRASIKSNQRLRTGYVQRTIKLTEFSIEIGETRIQCSSIFKWYVSDMYKSIHSNIM